MRAELEAQEAKSLSGAPQAGNDASNCGKHSDSVMLYCCCVLKSRCGAGLRVIITEVDVVVWMVNGCTTPAAETGDNANAACADGGNEVGSEGTQESTEDTAADSLMVHRMEVGRVETWSRQR